MTKYIFVDVDGVLNSGKQSPLKVKEMGFYLNLDPAHGRMLLDLAERTESDLVWGTTWQELANIHIREHLELPELPFLDLTPEKFSETNDLVKARAAIKYADGNRFAYFDDWATISRYLEVFSCENGLHIYVDPFHGLQQGHIEEAEKWLNS